MPSEKEEVQNTTGTAETEETPAIKAKTVDDVKRICEEAEKAKEGEDTPAEKEAENKTETAEEAKEENGSSQEKEENTNQNATESENKESAEVTTESEKRSLDAEEGEDTSPTKKVKTDEPAEEKAAE